MPWWTFTFPARPVMRWADPGDPAEFLRVEVQQIAGTRMLVAVHQRRRGQPAAPGQARAPRDPSRRRRTDADGPGDLRTRPALVAEYLDPELDGRRRGPGACRRPARASRQRRRPFA